jgi:hypothetical protein
VRYESSSLSCGSGPWVHAQRLGIRLSTWPRRFHHVARPLLHFTLEVREEVVAVRVDLERLAARRVPLRQRLVLLHRIVDELHRASLDLLVDGRHARDAERPGVLDAAVGIGVDHAPRAVLLLELRIPSGSSSPRARLRHSGDKGCRRTRRSRARWAGACRGRPGGSCRTGRSCSQSDSLARQPGPS